MMKLASERCVLPLSEPFVELLNGYLASVKVRRGVVLNFRDPDYSAERGGYHPVEIAVDGAGALLYATDFAYVGSAPYGEWAKELDFDFSLGLLQHSGHEWPIERGAELFGLWQRNFVAYHAMGAYQVTVKEGAL